MTCIAGIAEGGKVWIGGDSAGVSGMDITIRDDKKVFKNNEFIFGFTSSFRMSQILQYSFMPPKHVDGVDDHCFMCTSFIDSLIKLMKEKGFAKVDNNCVSGGTFLVGYRGRLYHICDDFQVSIAHDGVDAVGCDANYAIGALYVSRKSPRQRILDALSAAERYSSGVASPFIVEEI